MAPRAGQIYDQSLKIKVAASDASNNVKKITLYANGTKIRAYAPPRDGAKVGLEWMRARNLPYGPVTITIEALDDFGNTTRSDVVVRRVNPRTLPAQKTRVTLRVSGHGLVRTVRGSVRPVAASALPLTGRVLLSWQYQRGNTWVTLHKRGKNARKRFTYTQRLRKAGRWRVVADYSGERPFLNARASAKRFRAR